MSSENPKLVLEKIQGTDKQGNKFLILRTNPDKYYVFSGNVSEERWKDLEQNKTYYFDYHTSKKTGNKSVKDFKTVEIIKVGDLGEVRIIK